MVTPPATVPEHGWWFVFRGNRLLVHIGDDQGKVPYVDTPADLGLVTEQSHMLGWLAGEPCFAAEVKDETSPPVGMQFHGLRRLYGLMDENLFWVAGRAVQIVDWDRTHRFCGRCAAPTKRKERENVRVCPSCRLHAYPRVSPAMIVAVTYQGKILLARSSRHPSGMYSVLAGFVEPGETLEECVQREVREEVGLEVTRIRYFGSQPWPFPNSLMIAFTCESTGTQVTLADDEIAEADWFAADNLPNIPPPISISRRLIDNFVVQQSGPQASSGA
jgi:NAD+ diphosphatase